MKKLIQAAWTGRSINEDKLTRALLQYRNTRARREGLSHAQKLFGHPIQDTLPAHCRAFAEQWQRQITQAERQKAKTDEAVEKSYNQHAKPLPGLNVGNRVTVQNQDTKHWDVYCTITDIRPHRRYFIKTHSGRVLVRNRRFLRRRVPLSLPTAPMDHHHGEDHLEHHPPSPSHRNTQEDKSTN